MKTKANFSQFYALLKHMPGVDKEDLVWQYSNMLTGSLSDFYDSNPAGYRRMIEDMQKQVGANVAELKRWRSAILHRLQKAGIDTTDFHHVNRFMSNPKIAGKLLYQMSIEEMKALVPKLESILAKHNKEKVTEQTYANMN